MMAGEGNKYIFQVSLFYLAGFFETRCHKLVDQFVWLIQCNDAACI